jgi:hypothetical protein
MASQNIIGYVTIDTAANASDFGDLNVATSGGCAVDDNARCVYGGGYTSGFTDAISYFEIDTTSNSSDFGDLTVSRADIGGCSGD